MILLTNQIHIISYHTVIPGSRETCLQQNSILAPSGNGYISSLISDETGCGGTEAPWIIRAEVGQVIEVTLLDFALVNNTAITMARSPHCHVYVIFKVLPRSINIMLL